VVLEKNKRVETGLTPVAAKMGYAA